MSDYSSMKIAELKKELKAKGLPLAGNKQELVDRLEAAVGSALLDEHDDDLDLDQDDQLSEEAIEEVEKELQTPVDTKEETTTTKPEEKEPSENKENKEKDGKPKESPKTMDSEAKINARAERFGGFQSDEAKKAARAARFKDMMEGLKDESSKKIGSAPPVNLEQLKKRSERFGAVVSPVVQEVEVSEAIKKRRERFGIVTKDEPKPKKVLLNSGVNSVVMDEKMKSRLERFGS